MKVTSQTHNSDSEQEQCCVLNLSIHFGTICVICDDVNLLLDQILPTFTMRILTVFFPSLPVVPKEVTVIDVICVCADVFVCQITISSSLLLFDIEPYHLEEFH